MIIVGNRNQLINDQMLDDFELIKREFKNIIDIYTYDQLLEMLNNSIKAISNNKHNRERFNKIDIKESKLLKR